MAIFVAVVVADGCPPVGTQADFNVTSFVGKPWFAQMAQPVVYLTPNDLYCVRASYNLTSPTTVAVNNYANVGQINGPVKGGDLCAVIKDPSDPAKLTVMPKPLVFQTLASI